MRLFTLEAALAVMTTAGRCTTTTATITSLSGVRPITFGLGELGTASYLPGLLKERNAGRPALPGGWAARSSTTKSMPPLSSSPSPIAVLVLFAQRRIVSGLTAGSFR